MTIYEQAKRNGCYLEATCVSTSQSEWDNLMQGNTKANRKEAIKIALEAGIIDEDSAKKQLRNQSHNPYEHRKTKTHIIYIESCIEHFIKIN